MEIPRPYLIFLGDVQDQFAAKTAHGIVDWRPEHCVGQLRLPGCQAKLALPEMSIAEGISAAARTLLLGVVNPGGQLPAHWIASIVQALEAGLDVASGLHQRLSSFPEIAAAAARHGRQLFDVRHSEQRLAVGKGVKRQGRRLLSVGTDCSSGKKYSVLAMERAMRARGIDARFVATGQTGVLMSGRGIAIDAVPADFISGAVEWLSPDADPEHWDLIEGQGSLFHPSFSGVSLGLLHGAQPDALLICHEPTRSHMRNVEAPMPGIEELIELSLRLGRRSNPGIRPIGLAINTKALEEAPARQYLRKLEDQHQIPASDPMRFGVDKLVDHLLSEFPERSRA
ncbi:MAG: EBNA-1 nuclear protein [Planctomycetota bacterium]|nr:MAG: EBNA-1 nuclear protein [Planctomycetota bacterium]